VIGKKKQEAFVLERKDCLYSHMTASLLLWHWWIHKQILELISEFSKVIGYINKLNAFLYTSNEQ
jgi:hypothetical protein